MYSGHSAKPIFSAWPATARKPEPKQAHKGLLWGMYVRSIARGTGVAKPLVEAVLGHARERVELVQLTVVSENKAAQRSIAVADLSRTDMKSTL